MENDNSDFAQNSWPHLRKDLKKIVGDTAYNNWLKNLNFISFENNTLSFSVPTKFLRDWIVNNYSDKIKLEAKKYLKEIETIKFLVKPVGGRVVPGTARIIKSTDNHWKSSLDIRSNQGSSYPSDFGAPLDPRFTFENFVVGHIVALRSRPWRLIIPASLQMAGSPE